MKYLLYFNFHISQGMKLILKSRKLPLDRDEIGDCLVDSTQLH